jgi:D-glycero-D-manno-heptose 1,7-bisphosphate phosphatase
VTTRKALFLDRDGVINHEIGYLSRVGQVRFMPGIFELCRRAKRLDFLLLIVTNQAGIARGHYSESDFLRLMEWMSERFEENDAAIDRIFYCPYHPEFGIGDYKRDSPDRKPGPGMILRAASDLNLDLSQCVLVGDRSSDMQAGASAGVGSLYLLRGIDLPPRICGVNYMEIAHLREVETALDSVSSSPYGSAASHVR